MKSSPDPTYWLAPDAHLAQVDTDLVFLSVGRDAYFCLPDAADAVTPDTAGRMRVADPDWAKDLLQAGLLSDRSEPSSRVHLPVTLPPPHRSSLPPSAALPRLRDLPPAARAVADIATTYRGQSLERLLDRARRARDAPPSVSSALLEHAEDFHRWVPYTPVSGKCLLRSYMLLRHLRRAGLDAVWVFGVRTWPFHAHCWLQCEAVVLDDHVERVAAFTPILTV